MTTSWHPEERAASAQQELTDMARLLEARHGQRASAIAGFFTELHISRSDGERSRAWAGVASMIKRRARTRIEMT